MSCPGFENAVLEAALGESSSELEAHLSGCAACRTALAAERDLLGRIDTELQEALNVRPSPAFLPGVRQRVAALQTRPEASRSWWLAPALATLAGVLVVGHLARKTPPAPTKPLAIPARPAESTPVRAAEPVTARAPEPAPAPQAVTVPDTGPDAALDTPPETTERSTLPRVFVPPEDAQAVRRLARRLRGHAAQTAVMGPDVEGPFDFTLKPVEGRPEVVTMGHRARREAEHAFKEPPSFDRTVEKAGRDT